MKVIDSIWFTTSEWDCIGIVKVRNQYELKFYIGKGLGNNQEQDELHIANMGAKFPQEAGIKLLGE